MVVPPASGNSSSTTTTLRASPANGANPSPMPKQGLALTGNTYPQFNAASVPLSARQAPRLDLSSVERRGQPLAGRESPKRPRPHGLKEAPTYRPTEEEWKDPFQYIQKIAPEGRLFGIVKIIPPDAWNPDFAIDTERFHFRTRKQELNSVEGGTRANLNYLDQLHKFHKQRGNNLNRFPSVDKRPLDLYKLKKAVEIRGGFEKVCKLKKWAEIGRDLGYSGKIMSSLSTSLKNSYQRWLNPYEEYLQAAKPGVQQQLEFEYGGPMTPSPGQSPMKRSSHNTPAGFRGDSPALRASAALNASLKDCDETEKGTPVLEAPKPISHSGFTPVNAGGFTPVNASPRSFTAVNAVSGNMRDHDMGRKNQNRPQEEREQGTDARNAFRENIKSQDEHNLHRNGLPAAAWAGLKPRATSMDVRPGFIDGMKVDPFAPNGNHVNHLKRSRHSESTEPEAHREDDVNGTGSDPGGRRSKRLKREAAPTVAGSHMTLFRPSTPKIPGEKGSVQPGEKCETCGKPDEVSALMICEGCDSGYHKACLDARDKAESDENWHCPRCLVGTGEFGFEEGSVYSLKQFQEKAHNFKENYFLPKMPFDPVLNCKRPVTEEDVEREFWRLVESLTETVEVEYGADIHSTTHGSGFPTIEKNPLDPYSTDLWNLNILPLHPESLFRHIKSDISGMTVPWLYVGMCFSTFCWHNEDHYSYSANYQHFGATKTWYGIPGEDAERFEAAMRNAVPELFETQPDLLFQLVTLLPPDQLRKAGVRVYAIDQRAGQFVITFPQAYHAGFNHGFNFNEAVNFAPHDWEPCGQAGVERLQEFRRQPCFSHDELLLTAAARDSTIKTAKWLSPALERLRDREMDQRKYFVDRHQAAQDQRHDCKIEAPDGSTDSKCILGYEIDERDVPEEEYQCAYCKCYSFLSRFHCAKSDKVLCLDHAGTYDCCELSEKERFTGIDHTLRYRLSDESLCNTVQKVYDRARLPEVWASKLESALSDDPRPQLKALRSLVAEGERIPFELPQLPTLKAFVDRCNDWVEEATNYIVRKQQNRRKNEKAWRKGNSARAAEMEERDRELRKIENVVKLLAEADEISFDCPEINQLRERADGIRDFQRDAQAALHSPTTHSTQEFEDLVEIGRGFNVDIPEVEELDKVVQQKKWNDQVTDRRKQYLDIKEVADLVEKGTALGIPEQNQHMRLFKDQVEGGKMWEKKAKELMAAETVHYQQLDALAAQAATLPVCRDTMHAVDCFLNRQRQAHAQVVELYELSKNPDIRLRPKYKDVRETIDALAELHSKPTGTIDLEKEQKRHEDWMRKGKKLFGKANAPLHILMAHMQYVEQRNAACLRISDVPRAPAEPTSRGHTPDGSQSSNVMDSSGRDRDIFCICRQPESGMMIECEVCHEWYHGKCMKIPRGRIKEDDKYTCPICDWRVKIPRDAARPKLEDLMAWHDEVEQLPFQPDEEEVLFNIIDAALTFRNFIKTCIDSPLTTAEELPTQRFYLRKIEGAEVLLVQETNFFRKEVHRWAPVAPLTPPSLEHSFSTRKPRPTKQQKLMAQFGVDSPDSLPQNLRTKPHSFAKRKLSDATSKQPPPLKPAPGRSSTPMSQGGRTSSMGPVLTGSSASGGPYSAYDGNYGLSSPTRDSPRFATEGFMEEDHPMRSPGYGSHSPRGAGMTGAIFDGTNFGRDQTEESSVVCSPIGSDPGYDVAATDIIESILADLTRNEEALGGSHANDALAVTDEAHDDGEEPVRDQDSTMTDQYMD
ncbi:MAG: hypothetical protein M4579_001621 [Chaenotheca gracillima]|nr:MAG: hypothetical protein M4579_001621 [Chaenotheca gracillima]